MSHSCYATLTSITKSRTAAGLIHQYAYTLLWHVQCLIAVLECMLCCLSRTQDGHQIALLHCVHAGSELGHGDRRPRSRGGCFETWLIYYVARGLPLASPVGNSLLWSAVTHMQVVNSLPYSPDYM